MKQVLGWVAVGVTAVFVIFNLERADVWFFGIRVQMPLALVVIASTLVGAFASHALSSLKRTK